MIWKQPSLRGLFHFRLQGIDLGEYLHIKSDTTQL